MRLQSLPRAVQGVWRGSLGSGIFRLLVVLAVLAARTSGQLQFQPTAAQRQLILLVQDIQGRILQQNFLVNQLPELQLPELQLPAQVVERRVIAAEPQPQLVQVQPEPPKAQRVQPPPRTRQRQKPQANQTDKPQFLEPGVGRWLLNGDQSCLPCICEASSGCDETLGCDDRGFCGPFLLSQRYWQLAGKPLLRGDSADRPGASSDCLRDPFCAAEAVRGYLDRFAQDCDGDRRVDCFDLARVHFQGPFNCRAPLQPPTDFSETFKRCWDASRRTQR